MAKTAKSEEHKQPSEAVPSDDGYLLTLETVKRQYEQYLEVSEVYKLPVRLEERQDSQEPPTPERPLTINRI